jgi:hypothetical protein
MDASMAPWTFVATWKYMPHFFICVTFTSAFIGIGITINHILPPYEVSEKSILSLNKNGYT